MFPCLYIAGTSDTEGWITNPATADTDYDGWNDYYEIFTSSTNPICADTDGDGVWDKHDRDPKRDVMLKISPISGAAEGKYKLVIVTAFSLSGTGDDCYIPTPKVYAHEYESSLWTAYFDGTHGSSTELHYYANIDDDTRIQSNNLDFTIQLWRVDRYFGPIRKWDKKLVGGIDTYNIGNIGHSVVLNATKYDDSQEVKYEAKVKVETIGVEKANTIAIYDTNGTVFNGHYQEQERMNVIQLYVNDTGSGTPFEEGLNTIVIPTSLFTETIFNARVQNETLNETAIYSSNEEIFNFISVGRDGNTEQACEEIDFIIIRFNISSEDAMEVLNLLLECLVNETTNETAIVYSYVSTKENGTAAVLMNLPFSVLGLIPWYCDFENSEMGSKPETFEDWFWKPLKTIGTVIIGVILTIGMGIIELFTIMVDFFIEIFMDILSILQYILWLIIRAAILVFILMVYALFNAVMLVVFSLFLLAILPVYLIFGGSLEIEFFRLEYSFEDESLKIDLVTFFVENSFLKLEFPVAKFSIKINNHQIFSLESNIISYDEDVEYLGGSAFIYSDEDLGNSSSMLGFPFNFMEIVRLKHSRSNKILSEMSSLNQIIPHQSSSLTPKFSKNTVAPYGAIIIGGGDDDRDGYVDDVDNDGIPDNYDDFPNDSNEWIDIDGDGDGSNTDNDDDNDGINDNVDDDDDNDGILDTDESQYYLSQDNPDSDYDGLNDMWELDMANSLGTNPAIPDLFVEVDYIKDCKPNTKTTEVLCEITGVIIMVLSTACIVIGALPYVKACYPAAHSLNRLGYTFFFLNLGLSLIYPCEPFEPLKAYFSSKDLDLHIIINDELNENGKNMSPNELVDLEDQYHDYSYAIYTVFVESIGYSNTIGLAGNQFGSAIATYVYLLFGNSQQKIFGHELAHCIRIDHDEPSYHKDYFNFMSKGSFPICIPGLKFDDWQICSFELNNKYTVEA